MSDDLPVCDCGYYRDVCGCPEPPPERAIRAAEAKFGVSHPRHGEAALGDLEPWQMEALAADLRHLFATGRNPQLDDLDDLCPHFEGTCDRCGRPATYWSLPVDPTDDPMPQHTPPEDCPQHDDDDHTDAWSAGYTAGAKDRSAELARDLYGLADLIREQHLGWEATYDNIRRAADHYRKEGTR